jgi:hypothetical protein
MYSKKEVEDLAAKVQEIHRLIAEAEAFADLHQISFHLRPSFGVGGMYSPQTPEDDNLASWNPSSGGWLPSNQNC